MLRSLDSGTETFLDSLAKISQRMQRAQSRIATGLRFSTVSDDPDRVSALLQARADLVAVQDQQSNLGRVKNEVDAGEQALQSAVALVERIRALGSQGVTGTATGESRRAIAGEVGALLEQLGGISRTTFEGRYLFSGDNDQTAPYTIDLSQTNPVTTYAGATATRQIQHPNGTRFSVSRTAQEIFDSPVPAENVFFATGSLRTALLADDQAAIEAALENVIGSLTHLNGQLSFYGSVQNKVAEAAATGANMELQLRTHVSSLQDADLSESILDLQQAQLQQQAALQSRGQMPRSTLFDYLG